MNIRGNFIKILVLSLLFFGTLGKAAEYLAETRPPKVVDERLLRIAKAIRVEVEEITAAVADRTPEDKDLEEICFRVGILYHLARRDLQGVMKKAPPLTGPEKKYASDSVMTARSLSSFCGDMEKTSMDPGRVRITKGDVDELLIELKALDARAKDFINGAG